ncbi:hypothetical protein HHL16_23405 [Pseudoflavitalea sp. G-6-1-2]|uniref:hypothetical protein n=1 Tax=Pseudoflavitalea sp. G-6-1-2 TaxID=2728841 RepID=UPI00146DACE0|nr:hypothetical protein [Pseudoflavitalea sp. G-6-1-2]NML23847.1 hypothetical protein [Pseudoflavitalea sp. G-6-1-2]
MYQDINEKGEPINPIENKNDLASSKSRRMYVNNHQVIDILEMDHFDSGKYINSDTPECIFLDFDTQKSATFKSFSASSEVTSIKPFDEQTSFVRNPASDLFTNASDSILRIVDTIINNRPLKLVRTNHTRDSFQVKYSSLAQVWADPAVINFPLQLSHALSDRLNNAFVYKMHLPMYDLKHIMATTLEYEPVILPDSIKAIFESWSKKVNSQQEKPKK